MKVKALLFAILFTATTAVTAGAADNPLDWPPSAPGGQAILGMHIQDDFGVGMRNRLSKAVIPGPQPDCSSLDDPKCASLSSINWWILRVLPPCVDTNSKDDCVEGLEVTKNGITKQSNLVSRVSAGTWTADPARGFPIAGSQGLWSDPFSTDSNRNYFVNVFGDLSTPSQGTGTYQLSNFFASITPTSDAADISGTCIWNMQGRCGHRVSFDEGSRLALVLHLSPRLTGWLGGRLSNPQVTVATLNPSVNRIVISGEPVSVNVVGAQIPYATAPAKLVEFMRSTNPGCPAYECNVGITSSGPHTFAYLEAWKEITKDTASRTIPYWSVSQAPQSGLSPCVKDGFVGLVTTNATGYQQSMPALDGGELTYKVAGAHFMTDGKTLTQGTYNLLLRSDAARCVYGFSNSPIKASVSIVNESDIQSVATEVVNERDGWLYLSANGFHFSQPSIKIQLSQETPPTPQPEMTTQASPKLPVKKSTITCAKGKVKKKVTAAKPVCPAGYKKVA
ncbi:hypothetical protein MCEMRE196_01190 [Candidatus Nanopelagicaceae bacterium]